MDQVKIGKFIAQCRNEKNITQEELGEKLGVTNFTLKEKIEFHKKKATIEENT